MFCQQLLPYQLFHHTMSKLNIDVSIYPIQISGLDFVCNHYLDFDMWFIVSDLCKIDKCFTNVMGDSLSQHISPCHIHVHVGLQNTVNVLSSETNFLSVSIRSHGTRLI